jgi:hypothetical protein
MLLAKAYLPAVIMISHYPERKRGAGSDQRAYPLFAAPAMPCELQLKSLCRDLLIAVISLHVIRQCMPSNHFDTKAAIL